MSAASSCKQCLYGDTSVQIHCGLDAQFCILPLKKFDNYKNILYKLIEKNQKNALKGKILLHFSKFSTTSSAMALQPVTCGFITSDFCCSACHAPIMLPGSSVFHPQNSKPGIYIPWGKKGMHSLIVSDTVHLTHSRAFVPAPSTARDHAEPRPRYMDGACRRPSCASVQPLLPVLPLACSFLPVSPPC